MTIHWGDRPRNPAVSSTCPQVMIQWLNPILCFYLTMCWLTVKSYEIAHCGKLQNAVLNFELMKFYNFATWKEQLILIMIEAN